MTTEIISLIESIGFPIVVSVVAGWYIKYISDNHRKDILDLTERHDTAENAMIAAINNNTNVMIRICEKMGMEYTGEELE